MIHLPAKVAPATGEAFDSWLERTARYNGLSAGSLWAQIRQLDARQFEELTGIPPGDGQVPSVHSFPINTGRSPRETWRVLGAQWRCPTCGTAGKPRLVAWQLSFHPVCHQCRCYLTERPPLTATPAHPDMLDHTQHLLHYATFSPYRLESLRKLVAILVETIHAGGPAPILTIPVPAFPVERLKQLRHRAGSDPLAMANLLSMTADESAHDELIRQGWRHVPRDQLTGRDHMPDWLPAHPRPTLGRRWYDATIRMFDKFHNEVRRFCSTHGIEGRHLPNTLFLPDEFPLPPESQWPTRESAARILRFLITNEVPPHADLPEPHQGHLNAAVMGLGVQDRALIRRSLNHLVADGLIDYQRRRDTFHSPRLPSLLRSRLALSTASSDPGWPAVRLAQEWLWVHFTREPIGRETPTVMAWGRQADPELLLALHDHGETLLTRAELDVDHDPATRHNQHSNAAREAT